MMTGHKNLFNTPMFLKKLFSFYTGVELINNVVVVAGGQQRDLAIHIHASTLRQLPSHRDCHTFCISSHII